MSPKKFTVISNSLDPQIYTMIRQTANFRNYHFDDIKQALDHDLFDCVVYDQARPIGIGRIIGDGKISFIIKDVVVIPEYHNHGIGHLIMQCLLAYIDQVAVDGAYIGLMSTPHKEPFYEKYGFIRRPNNNYGSGMVKFHEKKNIRTR